MWGETGVQVGVGDVRGVCVCVCVCGWRGCVGSFIRGV